MQILSHNEAASILGTSEVETFLGQVDWTYPEANPACFIPKASGVKMALARAVARTLLERGPAVLWMTAFGLWSREEDWDLFDRYRLSYGEQRLVPDAPVHLFDSVQDVNAFTNILLLNLLFEWDVEVVSLDRTVAMTISHDKWIEYRFAPGHEDFAAVYEQGIRPLLKTASSLAR